MARVGVDLDGVIFDFEECLRKYLVIRKGYERDRLVTATQWELAHDWGMTRDEFVYHCERATELGWMFSSEPPINDAKWQLSRLRLAGHSVHLITARDFGPASKWNTCDWLSKWSMTFDSLDFSHSKTIRPLDYMIDDKPANCDELEAAGVVAALQDRPYNQDYDARLRVYSMKEFVDYVLAREEGNEADSPASDARTAA